MIRTESIKQMTIMMLGDRDLHGYDIHKELESRRIKIGIGRLYEILNQMHEEGFLNDSWSESGSGPKKRVYSLNSKGRDARETILTESIHTVHEFYGEYLRSLPHEKSPFALISRKLLQGLDPQSVIGYVVNKLTKPISLILKTLKATLPDATIYLVGPREVISENEIEGLSNLEGGYANIPTKNGLFDMLVLPGFSGEEPIASSTEEWRRVVKSSGRITVVTPTALLTQPEDPLNIGEFIEQREHPSDFTGTTPPEQELKHHLQTHFGNIETEYVVHISLITAMNPR